MYVLNLAEDNRILSAGVVLEDIDYDGQVIVDELPDDSDGKWVSNYIYDSENSEYIYDPLPRPEEPKPKPTTDEVLNVLLGIGGDA